jgi:hypothetical protein
LLPGLGHVSAAKSDQKIVGTAERLDRQAVENQSVALQVSSIPRKKGLEGPNPFIQRSGILLRSTDMPRDVLTKIRRLYGVVGLVRDFLYRRDCALQWIDCLCFFHFDVEGIVKTKITLSIKK